VGRERLFLLPVLSLTLEELGELLGRHLEEIEAGDCFFDGGIVDGLGMELLFDVIVEARLLHGFDIAGAGTVGDAVEDVDDFVAIGGGFLGLGRGCGQD
jgi:hypothetical protein